MHTRNIYLDKIRPFLGKPTIGLPIFLQVLVGQLNDIRQQVPFVRQTKLGIDYKGSLTQRAFPTT